MPPAALPPPAQGPSPSWGWPWALLWPQPPGPQAWLAPGDGAHSGRYCLHPLGVHPRSLPGPVAWSPGRDPISPERDRCAERLVALSLKVAIYTRNQALSWLLKVLLARPRTNHPLDLEGGDRQGQAHSPGLRAASAGPSPGSRRWAGLHTWRWTCQARGTLAGVRWPSWLQLPRVDRGAVPRWWAPAAGACSRGLRLELAKCLLSSAPARCSPRLGCGQILWKGKLGARGGSG